VRIISGLLLALPVGAISSSALAWGNQGHQIVALVGERHLTPAAQQAVAKLIGAEGGHLEDVATWADCIKRNTACASDDGAYDQKVHPETKPWHFVDIVITAPNYDPQKDCAKGDCIVAQIKAAQVILSKADSLPSDRLLALKFLVHFVGDVHQPLHAAYKNLPNGSSDIGGNLRFVRVPPGKQTAGKKTELHAFWDTDLVDDELADAAGNLVTYATSIDQGAAPQVGVIDPVAWADASHVLAKSAYTYSGVDGPHGVTPSDPVQLDLSYATKSRTIVRQQLRIAGLRLAVLLNEALDPGGAKQPVLTRHLDPRDFRN
jgi:hypothetical protein